MTSDLHDGNPSNPMHCNRQLHVIAQRIEFTVVVVVVVIAQQLFSYYYYYYYYYEIVH